MTDRPILFSGQMVRAILDGRKTQTRRPLTIRGHRKFSDFGRSETPGYDWTFRDSGLIWHDLKDHQLLDRLPHAAGDRLWVRETWYGEVGDLPPSYAATHERSDTGWRPSIHMPRWASRLTLIVTDVRVQRLQEISAQDTVAEGVQCATCEAMRRSACNQRGCFSSCVAFRALWNSLYGPEAWDDNPWVVATTFTAHHCNVDQLGESP